MKTRIQTVLKRLSEAEDICVLYAVESGSRAWGFASADSDWDVRFIYLHRPEWYLSVQPRRDVVEMAVNGDLDVSGWDLKKALLLFAKSNPPLLEWLRSPLIYEERFSATQKLRDLSALYFSARACMYHYLHMAEANYREYLYSEQVRLKKYFYVLRPVLACRWIEAHGTMPPMEFSALVTDQLPEMLHQPVGLLLKRKLAGDELSVGPRLREINEFLDSEIARLNACTVVGGPPVLPDLDLLDSTFLSVLSEVWG